MKKRYEKPFLEDAGALVKATAADTTCPSGLVLAQDLNTGDFVCIDPGEPPQPGGE